MKVKSYEDLIVWQRAMDLVAEVYKTTKQFPRDEAYGLTSQIRRAAVSVPSNIAEGQGRRTTGELLHFLSLARGSLQEVQTQLLIAQRLAYLDTDSAKLLLRRAYEVGRLLNGLSKSLATNA